MEPPLPNTSPPGAARAGRAFALRFISGKYQGGEFPLPAEGEIVVGRSSELDMVLVEDMVSRRHAKMTVSGDEIFIQDLGSTNGTFVNGEKVKRARLQEGDRILIGTSIIKLTASDDSAGPRAPLLADMSPQKPSQVHTMTGSIAEVPLPDLLQLFSASKKTGLLLVRTDADVGKLHLEKGMVVYSSVNDNHEVPPLKSFYRIMTWADGTFYMEAAEEFEFPARIEMSTEGLLMEAMRRIDEVNRLGPDLPPLSAQLSVSMPLTPKLRDLAPETLDVFQLVYNYGHFETVLNKSDAGDLETSEHVVKLVRAGYVRVE